MKSTILTVFAVFVLMFSVSLAVAENSTITLSEGETYTISSNDSSVNLSISYIGYENSVGEVNFLVGNEDTGSLAENDEFEVLGFNVTVDDILYTSREGAISKVEIILPANLSSELIVIEDDNETDDDSNETNVTDCEDDEVWNVTLEECVEIEDEDENETEIDDDENESREGLGKTIRGRVKGGVYTDEDGNQVRVSELAKMREAWFAGNYTAFETYVELNESEDGSLRAKLKNGRVAMIKLMPEIAHERALERLRLKNCGEDNNCTIELKEFNNESLRYEIQAERHYRIIGLFKAKAQEKVEIDAETGEVVGESRAWWRFLATLDEDDDETPEPVENDTNESA